jgi:hypothetical protein
VAVWADVFRAVHNAQVLLLAALAICLISAGGLVLARSARSGSSMDWRESLRQAGYQAVRNSVRADLRTAFSDANETHIEALPEGRFLVSGWVDLIAENGAAQRQAFSCTIFRNQAGDWALEGVSLIPQ